MTQAQLNQLTLEQLIKLNELVVKTVKAKRKQVIAATEIKNRRQSKGKSS